ncbi:hypothetical protein H7F50_17915 [Novosphingobium flavum]|uniref:Uncharacterized protein n=1 Tax=Novosphingobium aerophilum TaxID=2839843 RepID=A0A7X1FAY0_9SPHN|nr:hypothetical protein [Novosphingobium aerophilum]MBC2653596.1 hypothetical protein [Novosphingobium aerophilum]MBC2663618.1 hypothetical protein [Novosphingobium aerophilum]
MTRPAALDDLLRPAALLGLVGAALALGAPAPAGSAGPVPASQCRAGERVIYSCRFGPPARPAIGSICWRAAAVHYRYGPPGRPAIDLASTADWSNIHTGHVRGQGAGGYQEHVRFTNGQTDYIVFRGQDGALASRPGRTYSGIAVQGPTVGERTLACRAGATLAPSLVEAVTRLAPPEAELGETPDGPFDAWF